MLTAASQHTRDDGSGNKPRYPAVPRWDDMGIPRIKLSPEDSLIWHRIKAKIQEIKKIRRRRGESTDNTKACKGIMGVESYYRIERRYSPVGEGTDLREKLLDWDKKAHDVLTREQRGQAPVPLRTTQAIEPAKNPFAGTKENKKVLIGGIGLQDVYDAALEEVTGGNPFTETDDDENQALWRRIGSILHDAGYRQQQDE